MKQGRYAQGTAFLRHKGDLFSENSSMWDLAAYRIIYQAHPHTGDAWCIYPTYDYTHCIVDSLEDITHSLCTLEFAQRQAADGPYYHLLHSLGMYKPVTWEYSRLNLTHAVMSKRKLKFLVVYGYVGGWDDPRLCTLNGLRRRGYTGATLNRFCEAVGVTRAAMVARNELLEQLARQVSWRSSWRSDGLALPPGWPRFANGWPRLAPGWPRAPACL
jgi:glutaminyl-tRNA synthetase